MEPDATWIARALEGDLDTTEWAEFLHALEHDPSLGELFSKHAELHGLLGPVLESSESHERLVAACLEAVERQSVDGFSRAVESKIIQGRFRRRAIWAAAAVFLIAMLGIWNLSPNTLVATVTGVSHSDVGMPAPNTRFSKGDKLTLPGGLVELELAGRGSMILEGPAEITWSGPLSSRLTSGRALLRINENGHGYRVDTPQGSITDLGTEFGVAIDPDTGNVETHVFTGRVEARGTSDGPPVRLAENEALRFSSGRSDKIVAKPGDFYRSVPGPRRESLGMIHWSMDASENSIVSARANQLGGENAALKLYRDPSAAEGRFGKALQFDGKNQFAQSEYRGIGGNQARTVAFWLKVPADVRRGDRDSIISWGANEPDARGIWDIGLNRDPGVGKEGAIRIGVDDFSIGTIDLRDDQWHHVAVVLLPPAGPDTRQQLMVYLDGKPHSISQRSLKAVQTSVENAPHGVRIARFADFGKGQWHHLRGSVDEVYLFDNVLTQDEIRTLMERNKAPVDAGF